MPEGTELYKFLPNPKQQYARKKKKIIEIIETIEIK